MVKEADGGQRQRKQERVSRGLGKTECQSGRGDLYINATKI